MSTEEQPTSGSVPNAYGNALAWKWTRQMPTYVRRSGLPTLLYALRAMANPAGELRFNKDRKPIRITDIAKAACCREKDCRRYLEAAIRAGVVRTVGERKRGVPTLYVITPVPYPDWQAAEDYLKSTARDNSKRPAKWTQDPDTGSSGHSGPNHIGPLRPELTGGTPNEVRATPARTSSGHSGPTGSGHSGPNNPGDSQGTPHEVAEVSFKPQLVGGPANDIDHHDTTPPPAPDPDNPDTWHTCLTCRRPLFPDPRRPGRTKHTHCETRERTPA